jgi:hypothetical protein
LDWWVNGTSNLFKGKANLAASNNDAVVLWMGMEGCQMTKDEELDLALEVMQIKSTLSAFGPDEGVTFAQDTWAKLHAAMSAVVAQPAPVQDVSLIDEGKTAAKRQWVGLYDDDISALGLSIAKARALESLLKRRNT